MGLGRLEIWLDWRDNVGVVSNKNTPFNHEEVVKKVFQVISELISFCDCLCIEKCIGDYDLDYVLGILDWLMVALVFSLPFTSFHPCIS